MIQQKRIGVRNVVSKSHCLPTSNQSFSTGYDQKATGNALKTFFFQGQEDDECVSEECSRTCFSENLQISTKIPPWSLTSEQGIRDHAKESRQELVGFCEDLVLADENGNIVGARPYPLDVYFIQYVQDVLRLASCRPSVTHVTRPAFVFPFP